MRDHHSHKCSMSRLKNVREIEKSKSRMDDPVDIGHI